MIKLYRKILLYIIAFIAIAGLLPVNSHAEWGATIPYTNCDPAADPALDYLKTLQDGIYYPTKSCVTQGISLTSSANPFKVKVSFHPNLQFALLYVTENFVAFGATAYIAYYVATHSSVFTAVMAACEGTCPPFAEYSGHAAGLAAMAGALLADINLMISNGNGEKYISVGSFATMLDGGPLGPVANAEVRIKGNMACVYMRTLPIPFLAFVAERTDNFNSLYGVGATSPLMESDKVNCVYMPPMDQIIQPTVPPFLSKSCTNYDNNASWFRFPPSAGAAGGNSGVTQLGGVDTTTLGKSRSFTGVVVQCIQESMMNLFFNIHAGDTQTIFQKTQIQLQGIIRALMILYIVFLGYKYIILNKHGIRRHEFIWIIFKVGIVWYLALSSGFSSLLFPGIISSLQQVCALFINGAATGTSYDSAGNPITLSTAQTNLTNATTAYNIAQTDYNSARKSSSISNNPAASGSGAGGIPTKKAIRDAAYSTVQQDNLIVASYGYNYCNFQKFADLGLYSYTYKTESGGTSTKDMSFMQLWDAIDCRISKYLGVGADPNSPSQPYSLLFAVGSFFGGPLGIIVFCLVIVFLIFVILIITRVVHIYIVAFVALILLAYVFPLVMPMILFEYTKSSFESWMKQFVGYCVQTVILFAFLAFMFGIFDTIIYKGNHNFNQPNIDNTQTSSCNTPAVGSLNPTISANGHTIVSSLNTYTLIRSRDKFGNWVCEDPSALGCMFEEIGPGVIDVKILDATIFSYYTLLNKNNIGQCIFTTAAGVPSAITNGGGISQAKYLTLMIELIKVIFVSFIIHALMGLVEEFSFTLTNVAQSAAKLSSAPANNPRAIANATVGHAFQKVGKAGFSAGKLAFNKASGAMANKSRRNAIKSAKTSSPEKKDRK